MAQLTLSPASVTTDRLALLNRLQNRLAVLALGKVVLMVIRVFTLRSQTLGSGPAAGREAAGWSFVM